MSRAAAWPPAGDAAPRRAGSASGKAPLLPPARPAPLQRPPAARSAAIAPALPAAPAAAAAAGGAGGSGRGGHTVTPGNPAAGAGGGGGGGPGKGDGDGGGGDVSGERLEYDLLFTMDDERTLVKAGTLLPPTAFQTHVDNLRLQLKGGDWQRRLAPSFRDRTLARRHAEFQQARDLDTRAFLLFIAFLAICLEVIVNAGVIFGDASAVHIVLFVIAFLVVPLAWLHVLALKWRWKDRFSPRLGVLLETVPSFLMAMTAVYALDTMLIFFDESARLIPVRLVVILLMSLFSETTSITTILLQVTFFIVDVILLTTVGIELDSATDTEAIMLLVGLLAISLVITHYAYMSSLVVFWRGICHTLETTRRKDANSRLLRASQAERDFVSVISHETRTPLNAIIGCLDLLDLTLANPSAEVSEYLRLCRESSVLLLRLIEDVLCLGAIESHKLKLDTKEMVCQTVLMSALDVVAQMAMDRGLDVIADISVPVIPVIGDPDRLKQVVVNLLSNAIKFSPRSGEVAVYARLGQSFDSVTESMFPLTVTVRDNGVGISKENMAGLFKKFSRVLGNSVGGAGLGLVICKELVHLMHGSITVSSVPGKGSTFSFTAFFPVIKSESGNAETAQAALRFPGMRDSKFALQLRQSHLQRFLIIASPGMQAAVASAVRDLLGAEAATIFHMRPEELSTFSSWNVPVDCVIVNVPPTTADHVAWSIKRIFVKSNTGTGTPSVVTPSVLAPLISPQLLNLPHWQELMRELDQDFLRPVWKPFARERFARALCTPGGSVAAGGANDAVSLATPAKGSRTTSYSNLPPIGQSDDAMTASQLSFDPAPSNESSPQSRRGRIGAAAVTSSSALPGPPSPRKRPASNVDSKDSSHQSTTRNGRHRSRRGRRQHRQSVDDDDESVSDEDRARRRQQRRERRREHRRSQRRQADAQGAEDEPRRDDRDRAVVRQREPDDRRRPIEEQAREDGQQMAPARTIASDSAFPNLGHAPRSIGSAASAPVATNSPPPVPAAPEPAAPTAASLSRVLVCDDNIMNRKVVKALFGRLKIVPDDAENGQLGVERYVEAAQRNEPYTFVLMDLQMPVMDGNQAVTAIRTYEREQGLPRCTVVLYTADKSEFSIEDSGFDDVLVKPLGLQILKAMCVKWHVIDSE